MQTIIVTSADGEARRRKMLDEWGKVEGQDYQFERQYEVAPEPPAADPAPPKPAQAPVPAPPAQPRRSSVDRLPDYPTRQQAPTLRDTLAAAPAAHPASRRSAIGVVPA